MVKQSLEIETKVKKFLRIHRTNSRMLFLWILKHSGHGRRTVGSHGKQKSVAAPPPCVHSPAARPVRSLVVCTAPGTDRQVFVKAPVGTTRIAKARHGHRRDPTTQTAGGSQVQPAQPKTLDNNKALNRAQ